MMRYAVALFIIGVVALVAAEPDAAPAPAKSVKSVKSGYPGKSGYAPGYFFYGIYPGKCGNDGLYYNDPFSFVVCTNGNAYVQRCAPGSKNSGYGSFKVGSNYGYTDFCDVNLNDYANPAYVPAAPAKSGYHHPGPYYGGPYFGGYGGYPYYPW